MILISRSLLLFLLTLVTISQVACQQTGKPKEQPSSGAPSRPKVSFTITDKAYIDSLLNTALGQRFDSVDREVFGRPKEDSSEVGEFVSVVYRLELPEKAWNWVVDLEGIFTEQQEDTLTRAIAQFEKETGNQFLIMTLDQRMLVNQPLDSMINLIHNYWGVGQKEKNNGVVIGLSAGLEKILSDEETNAILQNYLLPYFKKGEYYTGVKNGLEAIMEKIK